MCFKNEVCYMIEKKDSVDKENTHFEGQQLLSKQIPEFI